MKAVIVSASKPLFYDAPIFNLPIGENNLIDLQVSILRNAGIEDISVVVGYQGELFSRSDVDVIVNNDWQHSGSAYSLLQGLNNSNELEDTLVVYGDTIFLPNFVKDILLTTSYFTVGCIISDETDFNEHIKIINGKVKDISFYDNSSIVFTGLFLIKTKKIEYLKNKINKNDSIGQIINTIVTDGEDVFTHVDNFGWMELRSKQAVNELKNKQEFLSKIIQVHTDWTLRSKKYNELDWANRDLLVSEIVNVFDGYNSNSALLDIGTGTGKILKALKDTFPQSECWGIDYSQAMLDKISNKEKYHLMRVNAENMVGIKSNYFNGVVARMVFHHLKNVSKQFKFLSNP